MTIQTGDTPMQMIPISEHPSNLDRTARLVLESVHDRWSVYSVKGGFVLITKGRAVVGLFPTDVAARDALASVQ